MEDDTLWQRQVYVNGISVLSLTGTVRQVQVGDSPQFQSLIHLDFQGIKLISHANCFPTRQEAVDHNFGMLGTIFVAQKQD